MHAAYCPAEMYAAARLRRKVGTSGARSIALVYSAMASA